MSSRFSFHLLLWSCLLILLGVMGWLSHSMLDAEKRRLAETHQIRLVEQSRLALWRMDSLLASMIAGENNRSPGEYFQGNALAEVRKEEGAMPDLSGFAKLYFQIDPRGNVSSPQKDRERLEYVLQLGRSGWGSRVVDAMKNLPRPASISAGKLAKSTKRKSSGECRAAGDRPPCGRSGTGDFRRHHGWKGAAEERLAAGAGSGKQEGFPAGNGRLQHA